MLTTAPKGSLAEQTAIPIDEYGSIKDNETMQTTK